MYRTYYVCSAGGFSEKGDDDFCPLCCTLDALHHILTHGESSKKWKGSNYYCCSSPVPFLIFALLEEIALMTPC